MPTGLRTQRKGSGEDDDSDCRQDGPVEKGGASRRRGTRPTETRRAGTAAPVHHVRRCHRGADHRRRRAGPRQGLHRHPGQRGPAGLGNLHPDPGRRYRQHSGRAPPGGRRRHLHRAESDDHHRRPVRRQSRTSGGLRRPAGVRRLRADHRQAVRQDGSVLPAAGHRHRDHHHRAVPGGRRRQPDHGQEHDQPAVQRRRRRHRGDRPQRGLQGGHQRRGFGERDGRRLRPGLAHRAGRPGDPGDGARHPLLQGFRRPDRGPDRHRRRYPGRLADGPARTSAT